MGSGLDLDHKLCVLGRFCLTGPRGEIRVPERKARALLIYLACRQSQLQARDRVTNLLWGKRFDAQARQSLRQTLARLRPLVGSFLHSTRDALWLDDSLACDVT